MPLKKEYDVVVIGGGINGLCCAAYLQKAGLHVAVFERREEVGTHCATEEVMSPGVKVNLHASMIGLIMMSPAYDDLELEKFGLEMLTSSEWGCFHPFRDKKAVLWHNWDARKHYEAWQRISEKDAETFRKIANYFAPYWVDLIDLFFIQRPTVENFGRLAEIFSGCPVLPPDHMEMSGIELADLLYESEHIKTAVLSRAITLMLYPWLKSVGSLTPVILSCDGFLNTECWTARGGSHALPHALAKCFLHYGGSLFQGCPVEKIIVESGAARGVALSKNAIYPEAEIRARRAVVSNLTVYPTFIQLVGEDKLSPEVAMAARSFDYGGDTLFTNYWVLREPPQWDGYPEEVSQAYTFNFGLEDIRDVERLTNDLVAGRLPDPPICAGGCCQGYAMADPTQAPPGQYTLMTWADVPYDLRRLGGPEKWDDIREEYGDKVEDLLCQYMPNLKRARLARYVQTPLDIYRRNPSAIKGAIAGGASAIHQFIFNRPFPGCGAPRTPIANLYISNSIWPYGATFVGAGYVAACTLAEDVGVRDQGWWSSKGLEPYIRMLSRRGIEWRGSVD